MLDLERFDNPKEVRVLGTAADLDEYTYLVAGCVGEFWTRLCFPACSQLREAGARTRCWLWESVMAWRFS